MSELITYKEALRVTLTELMDTNENSVVIGQGVTDFKAIFGSISGLYEKYPTRVIETPICEDSVAGVCIGLALNGMFPINTHIRADFGLLLFNQLINLGAKYRYMFGGNFQVPMLFRMVIGRSWGQGAQHSQSLQSLLAHIPGLRVFMPITASDIKSAYGYAMSGATGPVISFEHRLAYDLNVPNLTDDENHLSAYVIREGVDVTIVATSIMVIEAMRAADILKTHGVSVEIINLNCISHIDEDLILKSVKKTGLLVVADTSWVSFGVCAEISRIILAAGDIKMKAPPISLGMKPTPCPTAKSLEDLYYPELVDLIEAVSNVCGLKIPEGRTPDRQSMTDFYKHFKGPF